jgi:hypothetical protein
MKLFDWLEGVMKKMQWYDISILKLSMLAFALWLAIVWPQILSLPPWLYLVVFIVGWLYLAWKMFT